MPYFSMFETMVRTLKFLPSGGGYTSYANSISALFSNKYKQPYGRALISETNGKLFSHNHIKDDAWGEAYSRAAPDDIYSPLVQFDTVPVSSEWGQVYHKPVGIWTDGACYSACDFFAANMQDCGAATIMGSDLQTGGGGANVISYNTLLRDLLPVTFLPLPGQQGKNEL